MDRVEEGGAGADGRWRTAAGGGAIAGVPHTSDSCTVLARVWPRSEHARRCELNYGL